MSDKLTKQELEDLQSLGYIEGNFSTFPENVNPALKAKALAAWKEENDVKSPFDLPDSIETQNEFVRLRAAADGDKVMQKATGTDEDPLDHDKDGRKGGHIDNRGKTAKK